MLTILFIVGRTTLFTPVDINLEQVVDFLNSYACSMCTMYPILLHQMIWQKKIGKNIVSSGAEKVSEPGNLVPRKFFELRVLQKIFQKIFQHFEITLFTQLTSYNYSTLFTLYTLTSAAFKYLTEINYFTHSCHHNEVKW